MYGIFGEDQTDVDTLKEIVWKLKGEDRSLTIRGQGFRGCGNLLKSCSGPLRQLYDKGFRRFIICVDADGREPEAVRQEVENRVIKPAGLGDDALRFIAVPVQMIEAWILADIESATKIFKTWKPAEVKSPESIHDPKHELEKLSRQGVSRPRYIYTKHNPQIIEHLDLDRIAKKCSSFKQLQEFVLRSDVEDRPQ
jgi:hypothetical protein